MSANRLTILIHGDAGTGKSWLADSAPGPRLVLDAELRSLYTPSTKREWVPSAEPMPTDVGPDETIVVKVRTFQDLETTYNYLLAGHPFNTIIIDSLTEVQDRLIDVIAGTNQMQIQDWGRVLRDLAAYVRRFRDLRDHPTHPVWCMAMIAGSKANQSGKYIPMLQGQVANRIPYWVDVVGYLKPQLEEGVLHRNLIIQPYIGAFDAKDNTGILTNEYGPIIRNPDLTEMLKVLNKAPSGEEEDTNG